MNLLAVEQLDVYEQEAKRIANIHKILLCRKWKIIFLTKSRMWV